MQLLSWFDPNRPIPPQGGSGLQKIIAQIYFTTDKANLDSHDRQVLRLLAAHLKARQKRERLEIAIMSHADHRGDVDYNKALSRRRAAAVVRELERLVGTAPNYNVIMAVSSRGEQHAAQGTDNPSLLAGDRRVDIWVTDGSPFPKSPSLPQQTKVKRLTYRSFYKLESEYQGPSGQPKSATDQGIEAIGKLIMAWINNEFGQVVIGTESVAKRGFKTIDVNHRVNQVDIVIRHEVSGGWNSEFEEWKTTVQYTWGVAAPVVTVRVEKRYKNDIRRGEEVSVRTNKISRKEADKDPFLFPPEM